MASIKDRFIIPKKLDNQKIESYAERLLPFCTVYDDGEIALGDKKLTTLEKVKLALITRYLAHELDEKIPSEVTNEELVNCLNIPRDQIIARLKDARDEKFAIASEKGTIALPIKIGDFLNELELKNGDKKP
jgi:hypothetical protein